ncbi:amino acid ABC transporter substrate-binding protein [Rhizobium sp. KVB221]|uniref:Amino acid ABC transporter substrate-binding protein n=1 Tax=Rhizobium setariae TaxID=2801340 RepID=A0A936YRL5_9HYPH|nr:ABC transporter substrate-binding protein [Rhizobium setariae]MBL0375463.1 amino acid ABC transporter substrate-binding protein [Rhizobium setariae]
MKFITGLTAVAAAILVSSTPVSAAGCADGKTMTSGVLTIATGNPAYSPWVMNDAPESGEGYEAAVALELARRLGFEKSAVAWVRTSFDEAIQPGPKNFDFNLQQFSIRPERAQAIDFSDPYYLAGKALVVRKDVAERLGSDLSAEKIRDLQFGGASGQTSAIFISKVIKPTKDVLLYEDLSDVQAAMMANQAEATVVDVPTSLFLTAVRYPDGRIVGQFAKSNDETDDKFGLLFAKGSPLKDCANKALADMKADGTLANLEATWLNKKAGIPVIDLGK